MSLSVLRAVPLTWELCQALAPRLAPSDAFDCVALGHTPEQSLSMGLLMGPAWAALRTSTGTPVGALGYTQQGSIWSLWATLSRHEMIKVLKDTPEWVTFMLAASGKPCLHNHVPVANAKALKWIRRSGAFWVDDAPVSVCGHDCLYFETLPREDRPNV